jgi:hypothetical protein
MPFHIRAGQYIESAPGGPNQWLDASDGPLADQMVRLRKFLMEK